MTTAVKDIINFLPIQAEVGKEYELTAMVDPGNATNQMIEWSMVSGSGLIRKADTRYFLTPLSVGNVRVRGTVRNGKQE